MKRHPIPRGVWSAAAALVAVAAAGRTAAAKKPDAPVTVSKGKAGAEPEARVIEKKDADYVVRLTLKPGNLKTNHVAEVLLDINRNLDIPDPVTGDQKPMTGSKPLATVKSPEGKGQRDTTTYFAWPSEDPGGFAFHFTPTEDGLYEVTIAGTDPDKGPDAGEAAGFSVTYRIGAGTAAAQTEQSQVGTAVRKTVRRPVGAGRGRDNDGKLVKLMREVGDRYLNLESMLAHAPAHGAQADAMAEAHALSALLGQTKGLVPEGQSDSATEFDSLAAGSANVVESIATAASGKERVSAKTEFEKLEAVGCNACHAKYRFQITDDVSEWPKFAQKAVKQ